MSMNLEFLYRKKIPVGILGATGLVGQKMVQLLADHPWFQIEVLAASENSQGKPYKEAVEWKMNTPLDDIIGNMPIQSCTMDLPCSVLFSALSADVADELEEQYAEKGYTVISNASAHRMDPEVPLLIPEVNADHLQLLQEQTTKGAIVTNPNCIAIPLAMALKPLQDQYGVKEVQVVTMQAVSGAGSKADIVEKVNDNVLPYIEGEEEKVEREPKKILGEMRDGVLVPWEGKISAQCNRVSVSNGHTLTVSVLLHDKPEKQDILDVWESFSGEPQALQLPSAPLHPIQYFPDTDYPQPKVHREHEKGMVVCLGRLRECSVLDYKFVIISDNLTRGGAGAAILNAELMVKKGSIYW